MLHHSQDPIEAHQDERYPDDTFRFRWCQPQSYPELFRSPAPCRKPWRMGFIMWLCYLLAAEIPYLTFHVFCTSDLGPALVVVPLIALAGLAVCLGWSFLAAATSYRFSSNVVGIVLLLVLVGLIWYMNHALEASRSFS